MENIIKELKLKSKDINFSNPKHTDSQILRKANKLTVIKDETQSIAIRLGELADSIAKINNIDSTDEFKFKMQPFILEIIKEKKNKFLEL